MPAGVGCKSKSYAIAETMIGGQDNVHCVTASSYRRRHAIVGVMHQAHLHADSTRQESRD